MRIDDLQAALDDLSTERLQRLVDRLEHEPDIAVSVGTWRPQCPMVLAGFDPQAATSKVPEQWFASVWDRVAAPDPKWPFRLPFAHRTARRADIQLLVRGANAVLAHRAARQTLADELEHIHKQLAQVAAIFKTAGLSLAQSRAENLTERLVRLHAAAPGHRYVLGTVSSGGVMRAPEREAIQAALLRILDELHHLVRTPPPTTDHTRTRFDPAQLRRIELMVDEIQQALRQLHAQLDGATPGGRDRESPGRNALGAGGLDQPNSVRIAASRSGGLKPNGPSSPWKAIRPSRPIR